MFKSVEIKEIENRIGVTWRIKTFKDRNQLCKCNFCFDNPRQDFEDSKFYTFTMIRRFIIVIIKFYKSLFSPNNFGITGFVD